MAQILKDNVRESIIDSARKEFLEHGFEGSSMRRIALRSKMTVGNLYRYFKSKEDLNATIVASTYGIINAEVEKLTGGLLRFGEEGGGFSPSIDELKEKLSALSEKLVDVYKDHKVEFNILMMGSKLNKELTDWFASIISELIAGNFPELSKDDERVRLLSLCYAQSVFGGIKTILKESRQSEEDVRMMVKIYLNSFLAMLDKEKYDFTEI